MEETSLFEVDPVTNEIVYEEGEVLDDGSYVVENGGEGSVLGSETEVPQAQTFALPASDSGDVPVVLSEEVAEALLASTPASGSLSSSTIDYFDRLVDGLPSDYCYVAFRNDSDDSYAGSIVYGDDYDVSGNTVVFGEGAVEIAVSRSSGSSYSSYITYDASDASDSVVNLGQSGTILYYTNAVPGYPILGSGARPLEIGAFVTVGLVSAIAVAVLTKLLNRRS